MTGDRNNIGPKAAILSIFIVLLAITAQAASPQGPRLTLSKNGLDLGTVYFNQIDRLTFEIEITNTGNAPLTLGSVRACCGTRVSHWPKEPILPGKTEKIEAWFRVANRPTTIRRVVAIESNCVENPQTRFRVSGRIQQSTEPAAE